MMPLQRPQDFPHGRGDVGHHHLAALTGLADRFRFPIDLVPPSADILTAAALWPGQRRRSARSRHGYAAPGDRPRRRSARARAQAALPGNTCASAARAANRTPHSLARVNSLRSCSTVALTVNGETKPGPWFRFGWPRRHATSLATSSPVISVISLSLPKNLISSRRRPHAVAASARCCACSVQ